MEITCMSEKSESDQGVEEEDIERLGRMIIHHGEEMTRNLRIFEGDSLPSL